MKAATRFGGHPCWLVFFICLGFVTYSRGQGDNEAYLTISYAESITSTAVKELECGVRSISPYFTVSFAGIDLDTFGRDACGSCISISCVNSSDCRGGSETNVVAAVVDDADGPDVVQVNSFIARRLTGKPESELGDIPIQWSFVGCDDYGLVIKATDQNENSVVDAPVAEAPVAETPVAEAPVAEAPVAETPVAEAPSKITITPLPENDTDVVAEAPAAETPAAETPVAEAPVVEAPSKITITPLPENDTVVVQSPEAEPVAEKSSGTVTITPLQEEDVSEDDDKTSPLNNEYARMWVGDFNNRLTKAACGFSEATYIRRESWAAVNIFNFRSKYGFHPCGLCAEVQCSDPEDCNGEESLEVMFVDDCGSCSAGDLLISREGHDLLKASNKKAAIPIEWKLVSCKPPRGIYMSVFTNNPYYHRISFSGLSEPIDRVTINGMMSTRNHNGQYEFYADLSAGAKPYEIKLKAVSGETIQTYVQNLYSQPLRIQF